MSYFYVADITGYKSLLLTTLSVCVCPVHAPNLKTKRCRKAKFGRNSPRAGVTIFSLKRSKVGKSIRIIQWIRQVRIAKRMASC